MRLSIRITLAASILLLLGACACAFAGNIIHVKTTGLDTADGLTWATAKKTVQSALTAATSGDEVWVAAGMYYGGFTLKSGAGLYGGFVGTEASREQRNSSANQTILDGSGSRTVVTSPAGAATTTILDGFTIQNGAGTTGGGVYCKDCSPTIANNTITHNRATFGGGVYCDNSSAVMSGNIISENEGADTWGLSGMGGGVYCKNPSSLQILRNTIIDNFTPENGAGICCSQGSISITGNTIARNYSDGSGGGICCNNCTATILGNTISVNVSGSSGGGVFCGTPSFTVANNCVFGNTSSSGGGVYCYSATTGALTNNTIARNAARDGGGIYSSSNNSALTIRNNIVVFNSSGIYNTGGSLTLRSNDVYNPEGYNYSGVSSGTGDKSVDPQFAALDYGNLHIQSASPCRNAGYNSAVQAGWTDIDGQARIQDTYVDIGADESDGTTWSLTFPTVRVSPSGNDNNDGSSWESAKRTIQAGVDVAEATGGEVWVAAGTYAEYLKTGGYVYLYGGFAGTETERSERDSSANVTIIEGRVTAEGIGYRLGSIDGFTIQNVEGVLCHRASPEITNNVISGNRPRYQDGLIGGSGLACHRSSPIISRNVIRENRETGFGGGLACFRHSNPLISNNVITDNSASQQGGGIYSSGSGPIIVNNVIKSNSVTSVSTGYGGGGIYCSSTDPGALLVNNTIVGNGAMAGGGILGSSSTGVYNNIIAFNSSGVSGGMILRNNVVYNPYGDNYSGTSPGVGDIQADPMLASVQSGNLHVQPGSPCINAGYDSAVGASWVDLDGQPRIQGAHVDIGADESNGASWPVTPFVVRVSTLGDDQSDGSSWSAAKRTIQAGIDAAATTGGEVWVAEGVYNEMITVKPYTSVYGGFAGTESQRSQRDVPANETILDGNGANLSPMVSSASRGFGMASVDGLVIRNGGNGVWCQSYFIQVSNCLIRDNDGAGVYCSSGQAVVTQCQIIGNGLGGGGWASGITLQFGSGVIADNEIRASVGPGVYSRNSVLSVLNNRIIGSSSRGIEFSGCDGTIANNVITGNCTGQNGGGILWSGAKKGSIVNNSIVGNAAASGGGISCSNAPVSISNNIVAFNSSGINVSGTAPVLANNDVFNPDGSNYTGIAAGVGDISADPKLVSEQYGETHIQPDSPCRDTGTNGALQNGWRDIDGELRIQGLCVDIGADETNGIVREYTPAVVRVSPTGSDLNDGSSWENALRTIQAGVSVASEHGGEVWVAAGTYAEDVYWRAYTDLYGGFAGDETARESRDWVTNRTTILGDGSYATIRAIGYVTGNLSGFVITGGGSGGGISSMVAKPVIANNTITGNRIGISSTVLNLTIRDNVIAANGSDGVSASGSPIIVGNTVALNGGVGINCASGIAANNIVAWNAGGVKTGIGLALRNNCVYGNLDYNYSGIVDPTGSNGNISSDPGLVSADFMDLHLRLTSPCIDAGSDSDVQSDSLDIDGQARVQGTHVDIGADESDGVERVFTPAVVRVSPSGSDANDGSDWGSAKLTVKSAIDAASLHGGEVWVAAGTYNERLSLPSGVRIYGGFAGSENARSERNPSANITILDGQTAGHVVSIVDTGLNCTAVDGFTIRNGYHNDGGSGVYCYYSSSDISNNLITANQVGDQGGGGLRGYHSHLTIAGNVFSANGTGFFGEGGVSIEYSTATMTDNTVTGHRGNQSAVRIGSSTVSMSDNVIAANSTTSNGGGLYMSASTVNWLGGAIQGNTSTAEGGGAVYANGSTLTMSGCPMTGNNAFNNGGAINSLNTSLQLADCTIAGNTTSSLGGGVYRYGGSLSVSNCIVAYNSSGIYVTLNQTPATILRNNCVFGNTGYDYRNVSAGQGDISFDPLFVDRAGGDYHLTLFSPCINMGWNDAPGLPSTDMDGEPRTQGGTVDIGADECWLSAEVIRDAKRAANGIQVEFTDVIVTATFDGVFYIEAEDRSMGIRVEKVGHGLAAGAKVSITGALKTNAEGERYIEAETITETGSGSIRPLHINSRALGGVDWLYNASTGAGQKGVVGGLGLNNIGMLVTAWGKLSYLGGEYNVGDTKIDAAKAVADGMRTAGLETYVQITGVVSCCKDADGLHPTILATEIIPLN